MLQNDIRRCNLVFLALTERKRERGEREREKLEMVGSAVVIKTDDLSHSVYCNGLTHQGQNHQGYKASGLLSAALPPFPPIQRKRTQPLTTLSTG